MKSYLLENLTDEQFGKLHDAGVQYYQWETGIMIEEAQLDLALSALGATGTKKKTQYQGVYKLKLKFANAETAQGAGNTGNAANGNNRNTEQDEAARKREKQRQESRRRYIKACASRTKSILDAAASSAESNRKKLTGYKKRFVRTKRDEVFGAKIAEGDAASQTILSELERVRMVRGIRQVQVVPNRLLIATEILCATDPETGFRHEVGQFLITVYLDGSHDGVRWQNNSRRVDGLKEKMNAPTVFSGGEAAPSEIHATIMELIARFELSTVAELAIQFIESPEESEYTKHIKKWPLV